VRVQLLVEGKWLPDKTIDFGEVELRGGVKHRLISRKHGRRHYCLIVRAK